jgi:hypothetical protein
MAGLQLMNSLWYLFLFNRRPWKNGNGPHSSEHSSALPIWRFGDVLWLRGDLRFQWSGVSRCRTEATADSKVAPGPRWKNCGAWGEKELILQVYEAFLPSEWNLLEQIHFSEPGGRSKALYSPYKAFDESADHLLDGMGAQKQNDLSLTVPSMLRALVRLKFHIISSRIRWIYDLKLKGALDTSVLKVLLYSFRLCFIYPRATEIIACGIGRLTVLFHPLKCAILVHYCIWYLNSIWVLCIIIIK